MKRTLFALSFLSLLFGLTGFSIKVYMAEGTENPAMPIRPAVFKSRDFIRSEAVLQKTLDAMQECEPQA